MKCERHIVGGHVRRELGQVPELLLREPRPESVPLPPVPTERARVRRSSPASKPPGSPGRAQGGPGNWARSSERREARQACDFAFVHGLNLRSSRLPGFEPVKSERHPRSSVGTRGGGGPTLGLVFAQEQLWYLTQLAPDVATYTVPFRTFIFEGPAGRGRSLSAGALRRSPGGTEILADDASSTGPGWGFAQVLSPCEERDSLCRLRRTWRDGRPPTRRAEAQVARKVSLWAADSLSSCPKVPLHPLVSPFRLRPGRAAGICSTLGPVPRGGDRRLVHRRAAAASSPTAISTSAISRARPSGVASDARATPILDYSIFWQARTASPGSAPREDHRLFWAAPVWQAVRSVGVPTRPIPSSRPDVPGSDPTYSHSRLPLTERGLGARPEDRGDAHS